MTSSCVAMLFFESYRLIIGIGYVGESESTVYSCFCAICAVFASRLHEACKITKFFNRRRTKFSPLLMSYCFRLIAVVGLSVLLFFSSMASSLILLKPWPSLKKSANWSAFCTSVITGKDITLSQRTCRCCKSALLIYVAAVRSLTVCKILASEAECATFDNYALAVKHKEICDESSFVPKGANPFRRPREAAKCSDICEYCYGNASASCLSTGHSITANGMLCACRSRQGKLQFLCEGDHYTH